MITRKHQKLLLWIVAVLAGIYLLWITAVNLSVRPGWCTSDMYTDMEYARLAWQQKALFPEGWVFGNQLYAVATPSLAALFYGLTGSMMLAMGLASTVMAAAVLGSFLWMLRPLFSCRFHRLAAAVGFVSCVLLFGGPVREVNGWQLLFTMCSYYACYAVNAFLAFGLWLRAEKKLSVSGKLLMGICCILSFGTGIQSVRQTVIMTCPLLAAAAVRVLLCRKVSDRKLLLALGIAGANLLGLTAGKLLPVSQVEIFGAAEFLPVRQLIPSALDCLSHVFSLVGIENKPVAAIVGILCFGTLLWWLYRKVRRKEWAFLECGSLFLLGLGAVMAIDVLTTVEIRDIYYFLLYPFIALAAVDILRGWEKGGAYLTVAVLVGIFALNCPKLAVPEGRNVESVAQYLRDQQINTVYSGWNRGEKIALASGGELRAGFWNLAQEPFEAVDYLCDPQVYRQDPARCAYVFFSEEEADLAVNAAEARGERLVLLKHFPESDIYVYICSVNLMRCSE